MSLLDKSEVKLKATFDFSILVVGTIPVTSLFPTEKRRLVPERERVIETELLIETPVRKNLSTSFLGACQGTGFR